jgi:hypothetical protein
MVSQFRNSCRNESTQQAAEPLIFLFTGLGQTHLGAVICSDLQVGSCSTCSGLGSGLWPLVPLGSLLRSLWGHVFFGVWVSFLLLWQNTWEQST